MKVNYLTTGSSRTVKVDGHEIKFVLKCTTKLCL
ncbi:MAG: hypothetical protein ACLTGI_01745 [Hoylesella buccalis]